MAGHPVKTQTALLLGAAGAGMRALAGILSSGDWKVTGSDSLFDTNDGCHPPQRAPHGVDRIVPEGSLKSHTGSSSAPTTLVVASPAISTSHADITAARQAGIRCLSLPQALRFLFDDRHRVAVAGTHGKSTTTAIVAWLMHAAGRNVGHFFGAEQVGGLPEGAFGSDPVAVLEACEYLRGFEALEPTTLLITGIRPDHFDCFPAPIDQERAYGRLVRALPEHGCLIINDHCAISQRLADAASCRVVSCSSGEPSDPAGGRCEWTGRLLATGPEGSEMRLVGPDDRALEFRTALCGPHNLRNILAAVTLSTELGLDLASIQTGIETFPGLRRRFQRLPTWRGVHRIDDYAHHPDAIRDTLATIRSCFPENRLVAVFEPHQISRVHRLRAEFVEALSAADLRFIVPVFAARESASVAERLAASATLANPPENPDGSNVLVASLDHLPTTLHDSTRPGDVLLTMGAGQIDRIHNELD